MKIDNNMLNRAKKEFKAIQDDMKRRIKDTSIYSQLQVGKVYKLIEEKGKEIHVLYCRPNYSYENVIHGYPLNKKLQFYKGNRKSSQDYWLFKIKSIEEIEDNFTRETLDTYMLVSDGEEKAKIYL